MLDLHDFTVSIIVNDSVIDCQIFIANCLASLAPQEKLHLPVVTDSVDASEKRRGRPYQSGRSRRKIPIPLVCKYVPCFLL